MTARKRKAGGTLEELGFKVLSTEVDGPAVRYVLGYKGGEVGMTAYDGEDIAEIAKGWIAATKD